MARKHELQAAISLLEILSLERIPATNRDEILTEIVDAARNLFKAQTASIVLINPINELLFGEQIVSPPQTASASQDIVNALFQRTLNEPDQLLLLKWFGKESKEAFPSVTKDSRSFASVLVKTPRRQKPLALLYMDFARRRTFDAHFKTLTRMFIDRAASALQNSWSLSRYQKVAQIGQEINQSLETISLLFDKLCEHITGILDVSYFFMLTIYNAQSDSLDYYMLERGKQWEQHDQPVKGACEWVLNERKSLNITHLSVQRDDLPAQVIDVKDEQALVFVPLIFRDLSLGVLSIQSPTPYAYSAEDINVLELLGHHVASALSNLRLFQNLHLLNEAGQLLTKDLDSQQVLENIVEQIREITQADVVNLFPYLKLTNAFEFPPRSSGGLRRPDIAPPTFSRPDDIASLALKRGVPEYATDSSKIFEALGGDSDQRLGNFEIREGIHSTAAVPLLIGDEPFGVLFVNFRQPQRFDAPQRLLIESLSSNAAIAIKNSREFDALTRRRIQEMETIRRIDQEFSRTLKLSEVMLTILELTTEWLQSEAVDKELNAAILIYNREMNELKVKEAIGPNAGSRLGRTIPLDARKGITYWVFTNKLPALVRNVHTDPNWRSRYYEVDSTTVSELDVPLLDDKGQIIGVISYESSREGAFNQEHQDFTVTVAQRAALAIQNAQSYEREERLQNRLRALHHVDRTIIEQLDDPDHVMRMVLQDALRLTQAEKGDLHLYEEERPETTYFAYRDGDEILPAERIEADRNRQIKRGIVSHVAETGEAYRTLGDASADQYYEGDPGIRSEVAVPLTAATGNLVGVLNLESRQYLAFNDDDVEILSLFAGQAVIAIQNARAYARAEEESNRFRWLSDAGRKLGEIIDSAQLDQAYEIVIKILEENNKGQSVIRRYNPETKQLIRKKVGRQRAIVPFEAIESVDVEWLMSQRGSPIVIPRVQNLALPARPKISDPAINSLVITHIQFGENYYGILALSHEQENYFKEADVNLTEGLANQLAITIHRLDSLQSQQEAEQRVNEAKMMTSVAQLAYEVTHRLDNDLPIIRERAKSIRRELQQTEECLTPDIDKYFDEILDNVRKSLSLTKDLKDDVARFGEGGQVNAPVVLPARRLLDDAKSVFPHIPQHITLTVDLADDVADVFVDPKQIVNALYNLVANAVDALAGQGELVVRAYNSGRHVRMEVADNGPGIGPEDQTRIFNLFYSTKKSTGFGLWSARLNIISNGGDLDVSSEPGQGATFIISLPKA